MNWITGNARLTAKGGLAVGSNGKTSTEDTYTVILNNGTRPIAGLYGIPAQDSPHPDASSNEMFASLVAKTIDFEQPDPTSNIWLARVRYEQVGTSVSGGEGDDGVWTTARIARSSHSETLTEDANGKIVVNAAGDAFEDAPNIDRDFLEVILVKRCSASPVATVEALNGTINSSNDSVLGISIPARCGRVKLEAERLFGQGKTWQLSIHITINPNTWDLKVLENGYRYKDIEGNLVKFTDITSDGKTVECSSPQLLGPEGGDGRGRGPYYAVFQPYKDASWSRLRLPTNV